MIGWHLGGTLFLFRWIFRDPKVDVRLLAVGALLPDLVDLPLGTLLLADSYSSGELWAHTLAAPTVYMSLVLLATRRGRRRRGLMALGVGWLFHLLLDGMWTDATTFFWPLFGDFPPGPTPYWVGAWDRALRDPLRWVRELAGWTYLAVLWARLELWRPEVRRQLLASGRLPQVATPGATG